MLSCGRVVNLLAMGCYRCLGELYRDDEHGGVGLEQHAVGDAGIEQT